MKSYRIIACLLSMALAAPGPAFATPPRPAPASRLSGLLASEALSGRAQSFLWRRAFGAHRLMSVAFLAAVPLQQNVPSLASDDFLLWNVLHRVDLVVSAIMLRIAISSKQQRATPYSSLAIAGFLLASVLAIEHGYSPLWAVPKVALSIAILLLATYVATPAQNVPPIARFGRYIFSFVLLRIVLKWWFETDNSVDAEAVLAGLLMPYERIRITVGFWAQAYAARNLTEEIRGAGIQTPIEISVISKSPGIDDLLPMRDVRGLFSDVSHLALTNSLPNLATPGVLRIFLMGIEQPFEYNPDSASVSMSMQRFKTWPGRFSAKRLTTWANRFRLEKERPKIVLGSVYPTDSSRLGGDDLWEFITQMTKELSPLRPQFLIVPRTRGTTFSWREAARQADIPLRIFRQSSVDGTLTEHFKSAGAEDNATQLFEGYGLLRLLYALGDLAVLPTPHNMAEPMALGKPVLFHYIDNNELLANYVESTGAGMPYHILFDLIKKAVPFFKNPRRNQEWKGDVDRAARDFRQTMIQPGVQPLIQLLQHSA